LVLIVLAVSLLSCKKALVTENTPAHINVGESYYTQFVIRYEKRTHLTTNYRRGAAIPVNTRVKLLKITSKIIEVEVDTIAMTLVVKNIQKHTNDDVYQAFDKLFATQKVNLAIFNTLENKYIKRGTIVKGMGKSAVTVAIGYPPVTETHSLEANSWVYWSSRYNKFRVDFNNGKVSRIVD
jgi:hypothetical protein